jgi:LacI family transcriptional regulator
MNSRGTAVTIREVAQAASVSPATVSRALNGPSAVRPDVRDRVLKAVAELGYRPNGRARSLRTRATMVLGVLVSDIMNPFFTAVVRSVEDTAQEAGYSVILANTDEDLQKEARYLEVAAAEQVAGVVLSPASTSQTRVDVLTERGIPVVTFDRRLRTAEVDSVTIDNVQAAREATLHLVAQGCRRIGFIAGLATTTTGEDRLAGYRAALTRSGRPVDERLIARGNYRREGGYAAARQLLHAGRAPDGLFVSNNLMTLGALDALAEAGLRVPEDIAVVGFDDATWALGQRSQLTVVSQPTYELGQQATNLLLRRVGREELPVQRIVLRATLTVRASSRRLAS